uniref:Uncharacterized protein n=1 Tax=Arion vulgaris TaxID=1028688 RepID=A0A0B7B5S9_9EUPU
MYYTGLSSNGSQSITSQGADKPTNIYMPAAGPYGHVPAGYQQAQPGIPGLAPRFAAAPQAYAVVSNGSPTGYTTISPAYHSLPYSSLQTIPTSTHAYISAAQYPGMSYQTTMAPRSAPPSPYPAPVQAGAPLFATGYSTMTGGIPAPAGRSYTIGGVPGYPQGYPLPAAYHGATYGPPF